MGVRQRRWRRTPVRVTGPASAVIGAIFAFAMAASFYLPEARAALISLSDLPSAQSYRSPLAEPAAGSEADAGAPMPSIDLPRLVGDASATAPLGAWFEGREFDAGAIDSKPRLDSEAGDCVYPYSFLRSLGRGRDDCGVLNPAADGPEVLSLPFLALWAWVLVICSVAGVHYFYGVWRVRRWLRRMRAQGLMPSPANRRNVSAHNARQSRPRSRRYAG